MRATRALLWLLLGCQPASGEPPAAERSPAPATAAPASASAVAPAARAPEPDFVRIAFAGDLNLALEVGRALDSGAHPPGFPFHEVGERLRAADWLVGNLECVASLKGKIETDHNPFRCDNAIPPLQAAGFDLVSVANNHALDFGRVAFFDMLANLDAASLPHFGKETFTFRRQPPYIVTLAGIRIGLLAYYVLPQKPLAELVEARRQVDVLIPFMHWGREDDPQPLELQRRLARDMIDAGADAVVGTHAHVPQPTAWYRGKLIAYGIGNFVFSGMTHTELHRTGQLLELDVGKTGVRAARIIEVRLGEDGAPRFVTDPAAVPDLRALEE